MKKEFDIAVIGGGAAGLFFTALASEKNKSIILIDKNQRVGKKLSATGNGRCNLSNIRMSKENFHGSFSRYTEGILAKIPPEKLIEIFRSFGLITRIDESGRVYPKSNNANTVLDVLRFNCEKPSVDILLEAKVTNIIKYKDFFKIKTESQEISAKKVIIACGNAASPKSGGDKSIFSILRALGHNNTSLSPALCPVNSNSEHLKSLKGLRALGKVSLLKEGKTIRTEIGEIQFTDKSLSGICVFNLSQYIEREGNYTLRLNLLPEFDYGEIVDILKVNRLRYKNLDAENLLTGVFVKRISHVLLKESGIKLNKKVSEIDDKELKLLAKAINSLDFKVFAPSDFSVAQVTKGGIKGNEINPETMESKIVDNLYILGETIDCNGDCGGYNLHFAFATAYLAVKSIC